MTRHWWTTSPASCSWTLQGRISRHGTAAPWDSARTSSHLAAAASVNLCLASTVTLTSQQ